MAKIKPLETEISNRSSSNSINKPPTPDAHPVSATYRQILKKWIELSRLQFSISFDELMLWIVVISIFGNDFRLLVLSANKGRFAWIIFNLYDLDDSIASLFSVIFVLFTVELCLRCWACSSLVMVSNCKFKSNGYFLGFHFWLDVLVICSTFLDTSWASKFKQGVANYDTFESWSRALRIIRCIRLIKVVRQIYNSPGSQPLPNIKSQAINEDSSESSQSKSRIGAKLSEASVRRLTVVVLLSLSAVIMFTYSPPTHELEQEAFKHLFSSELNDSAVIFNDTVTHLRTYDDGSDRLVYLSHCVGNRCYSWRSDESDDDESLRNEERLTWHRSSLLEDFYQHETIGVTSLKSQVKQLALNNIFMMTFAMFNLFLGSLLITNDARRLVILPIQRMVKIVEIAAADPLADFQVSFSSPSSESEEYETKMLESTIAKISGLLRVGLGEAGAGIIVESLAKSDMNDDKCQCPIGPGKRVHAIFGFADIRGYAELTRCLGGDIMHFTNSVASIVHECVASSFGTNNRNLGSTFLNVWTIGDDSELLNYQHQSQSRTLSRKVSFYQSGMSQFSQTMDPPSSPQLSTCAEDDDGSRSPSPKTANSSPLLISAVKLSDKDTVDLKKIHGVDCLADSALLSIIKTICRTGKDVTMIEYQSSLRLARFVASCKKFPNMSFGLHVGWAIEGAVGSARKIDATYLSPHVNMTARLNSATRQYGTDILMSEDFVQLLSSEIRKICRKIDVVTVKGSEQPIGIYTFDLRLPEGQTCDIESWYDGNIAKLQSHLTQAFRSQFDNGLSGYLNGYWEEAIEVLERCDEMMESYGGDGPSKTLVTFMRQNMHSQRCDWQGFRALTSK